MLPEDAVILPSQTLGELHGVLTCKAGRQAGEVRDVLLEWADAFSVADSTWTAMQMALDAVADHGLQIWDALILAVAAEQHCRLLLSEDFQHGFTWHGVTVVNPFVSPEHALLEALLSKD